MIRRKSNEFNALLYSSPYDHLKWGDHQLRIKHSVSLLPIFGTVSSCADLSAGDGAIINAVECETKYIGDLVPQHPICGLIEDTINEVPHVDLFILTETLEHLEDPAGLLRKLRHKTSRILVSTPLNEDERFNPEHLWVWDKEGVEQMLVDASFSPMAYSELSFVGCYCNVRYQVWCCK